jgi:regulator of RNase E activity RraA
MKFPVFHGGIGPLDTKGRARMMERDIPVQCASVHVESGDIVFGDVDGVVVIPIKHAETVIAKAFEKAQGEDNTRDELRAGKLLGDVFARHGIL